LKPKSETLTISVASWNLNDVKKAYEDVDLKPWLLPMESVYPDIFIIGFQEIEQKNAAGSKSIDK
jgi:exonuclease III